MEGLVAEGTDVTYDLDPGDVLDEIVLKFKLAPIKLIDPVSSVQKKKKGKGGR